MGAVTKEVGFCLRDLADGALGARGGGIGPVEVGSDASPVEKDTLGARTEFGAGGGEAMDAGCESPGSRYPGDVGRGRHLGRDSSVSRIALVDILAVQAALPDGCDG